jgi:hypothetical protein
MCDRSQFYNWILWEHFHLRSELTDKKIKHMGIIIFGKYKTVYKIYSRVLHVMYVIIEKDSPVHF